MLINFDKHIEKLDKVRRGEIKEGLKLGHERLDEHFRFKYGNLLVCLGHANVGKTTVILYLMLLYSMKHKIKWLVFSSENEPYSIIKKLIEFKAQEVITKIQESDYKEHYEWVFQHFKFIDGEKLYTYKDILSLAESVKKAWDYQGLMLDPYNSLSIDRDTLKGINKHDYDYQATSEMRIFCKKNNVTMWLNTHAATEALRKKHAKGEYYEGHPIPPMASDVEGGGKFVNRADDFIVIHRYIQHPSDWMYSHLHVRKIKEIDTGGRPTPLDDPIRLASIINNVGFTIEGKNLINKPQYKQAEVPF